MQKNRPPRQRTRRQDDQALARDERIWELRSKGMSQSAIGEIVGVDQCTVSTSLKRISERVIKTMTDEVGKEKLILTRQYEHIVSEAMAAWEASKKASRTVRKTTRTPGGEGVEPEEEVIVQEARDQTGDPVYLETAMKAMAEVKKIWGLDAPQKHELSGPGGTPLAIQVVEVMPPITIDAEVIGSHPLELTDNQEQS